MNKLGLVLVAGFLALATYTQAGDVLNEGFEGGTIPAGWQIWETGDDSDVVWEVTTNFPRSGVYAVFHSLSAAYDLDNWLVTPTYNLMDFDSLYVRFWYAFTFRDYYTYTGFLYSTNASPTSADFAEVDELPIPPEESSYIEFYRDISYCAGNEYITFAWQYTGRDGHTVLVDDIKIWGCETAVEPASLGAVKTSFK